jgi:DNA-binding transcriptional LysR family regulator
VGEHLSFRRAASVLGVRQSAISRRAWALEHELRLSLFERHRSGVRGTGAGARFLQQARDALGQLHRAAKTAGAQRAAAQLADYVGILSSMAAGFLRELIQRYTEQHPDVAIQILEGASADQVTAVRKRQLDVAFTLDTTDATGCETIPLWNERIFDVLSRTTLRRADTKRLNGRIFGMKVSSSSSPSVTLRFVAGLPSD